MKLVYSLTILLLVYIMLAFAQRSKMKNTVMSSKLLKLSYMAGLTVIASVMAMMLPYHELALFMQTLHYASTEWMLIYLLSFLEDYTNIFEGRKTVQLTVFCLSAISSVMMMLNSVFHNVVYCIYEFVDGTRYRIFVNIIPWYSFHEVLSYILAVGCLLILILKSVNSISFYRGKYIPAAIAFIITMILEGVCAFNNTKLDYALFGYVFLAMFLVYYTVYYTNKPLVDRTLAYAVDESNSGVICFDIENKCIYANDNISRLFPDFTSIEDYEKLFNEYNTINTLSDNYSKVIKKEYEVNGETRHFEITFSNIKDDNSAIIGKSFFVTDKTEDVLALEKANYAATHDELTGLLNSSAFYDAVKRRVKKGEQAYMLAADIKEFKLINDLFGHSKGNEILVAFGRSLKEELGDNSLVCRLNSDRYGIYITEEDFDEQKFIDATKPAMALLENEHLKMYIHYGVYKIAKGSKDPAIMYDHARIALTFIKNDYDKFFNYYDADILQKIVREKSIVGEFDKAIEEKQFKMFLQPQVFASSGKLAGAEALVRWEHPEKGMISPGVFIPVLEKSGFIHRLDRYMWEEAAKKLKEWKDKGRNNYHISVNISPTDFYYLDVYKTIVDIVEKYEIDPKNLKLEITESAFMNDPLEQLEFISRLKKYGFQVEIDDFGSGYSSLNMLKDMKVDVLKIDMGFLRETEEDVRAKIIVESVIKLAQALEMIVVTEGVETKEQIEFLREAGCDIFQGYYFDKPISVEEYEDKYFV